MQRLFWLLLVCAGTLAAQEMPGHIQLKVLPDLAPAGDGAPTKALPRVIPNAAVPAKVADSLNTRFAKLDADQRKMRHECLATPKVVKDDMGDWSQDVSVTMRGPRFLSLYLENDWYCNGMPHPDDAESGLVYDMNDGAPINWLAALPGAVKGYAAKDASGQTWIKWAPLLQAVMQNQTADCKDSFKDRGDEFTLWLDGDRGALMARLTGLTHFDSEMCVPEVELDIATLKKLHVNPAVTDALTAAMQDPSPLAVKRRGAAHAQDVEAQKQQAQALKEDGK